MLALTSRSIKVGSPLSKGFLLSSAFVRGMMRCLLMVGEVSVVGLVEVRGVEDVFAAVVRCLCLVLARLTMRRQMHCHKFGRRVK